MSSSTSAFNPEPIRNLNLIHCRWGQYTRDIEGTPTLVPITFNCTSKGLPSYKDAASWNVSSDNPYEFTGRTVTGKSEGIETIELVIETDPIVVYQRLLTCFGKGYQSDLELTYLPRKYYQSKYFTASADGGYDGTFKNVFPESMYPVYYEAEDYSNDEFTIVVPRCVMIGLAPSGGDNNSASTTTVKFQAEGGPIENQAFIVRTHFFSTNEDDYGYPTAAWDGIPKEGKGNGSNPDWLYGTTSGDTGGNGG